MTIPRVSQVPVETITDAPATGTPVQTTQVVGETLTLTDPPPIRASQIISEAAFTPLSNSFVRADQVIVEAIYKDPPPAQFSQFVVESGYAPVAPVQADHFVIEAIHRNPPDALPGDLAWMVSPNWKNGVTERLEFKSWDVRSHSGKGNRAALRWTPRLSVEFDILAHSTEAPLVDLMIAASQSSVYMLPRWQYGAALGFTLPAGSLTIACDTTDREFVAGGRAALRLNSRSYELVQVLQVFPTYIQLSAPTVAEWPASARHYPVARARLSDSQTAGSST